MIPLMSVELTEQELIDIHDCIKEAQENVSGDLWNRLEVWRARFSDERVKLNDQAL